MLHRYKLAVFDIDGTLVDSERRMSVETKEALLALKQGDILLGLASGRSLDQLKVYEQEWGVSFDFAIGLNGSRLYDGLDQKAYEFFDLKKEWIKEIVELMEPFDLNCHLYHEAYTLYLRDDERAQKARQNKRRPVMIAKTPADLYARDVPKIMYTMNEELSHTIEAYVNKQGEKPYKLVRTQPTVLEFVPTMCSKQYALKVFCEKHGFELAEVVAFGDTSNDNELIEAAGLGVCMVNGSGDTKKLADMVTEKSNDENGVAVFIRKYLYQEEGSDQF